MKTVTTYKTLFEALEKTSKETLKEKRFAMKNYKIPFLY